MLAFLQVFFDNFSLVLKLSFDKENCALGFEWERYLSLCHTNARVQFLVLYPHRRFKSVYMTKAIIKKKRDKWNICSYLFQAIYDCQYSNLINLLIHCRGHRIPFPFNIIRFSQLSLRVFDLFQRLFVVVTATTSL